MQNPAVQPPADPANLGQNQLRAIDVSKDFDVDPRTGEVTPKAPKSLPQAPVTSQTIEQPPAAGDPNFENRLATEREQSTSGTLAESIPAGGVDVGTPLENTRYAQPEAGNPQGDLRNPQPQGPRALTEVASEAGNQLVERYKRATTPSSLSSSEAVRDAQGRPRMPADLNKVLDQGGREAAKKHVQEISDLATGKTKGLTGNPTVDAILAAANIPSEISGDMIADVLRESGVDPTIANDIGLATGVIGSLIYGAKTPILLGAPAALGRYAKGIGLLGEGATTMEEAANIARAAAELATKESVGLHRDFVSTGKALGIEGGDLPKGTKVFHGTGAIFDKAAMDEGLWVAENPKTASVYAVNNRGEAPNVRPYVLAPDAKLAPEAAFNYDLGQADNVAALRSQGYDAVFFEGKENGKGAHYLVLNPEVLVERFTGETAAVVNRLAEDAGTTPRIAQEAVLAFKRLARDNADDLAPLMENLADASRSSGLDTVAPSMANNQKALATAGGAATMLMVAANAEKESGVTPDHIEAGFPGVGGNRQMMKVLIEAVRRLRNIPGKVHELPPAAAEVALDVLTAPNAQIKAGDKLLGLDWVGMSKDADHLPNTIKTVREAFEAQIKADSRGVVSHELERQMAQTMTELGYDAQAAVAKWKEGGRAVVSTEIMATAALTKEAYKETDRLAQLALKTGNPSDLENYGRQLGVFGSLVQVLDGQAEEAGRALGVFRAMVPDVPKGARAMAASEMELAQKGLSPLGGKVAQQATSQAPAAGAAVAPAAGARAARGGAFQGPPSPQAITTVGNAMVQNAQQMQAQYLQTLLQAWSQLPKSAQRGAFIRELGRWGLDFIKELFYNSMLFTFPGQLANTAGNTAAVLGEQMSRIVGAGIGAVRHDLLGLGPAGTSLKEITDGSFRGMIDSITEAFVVAGKSFVTGTPQSRGVTGGSVTKTPYAISGERVSDFAALAGYQLPNAVYHGINTLGMTLGAGTRAMMAGDEWMKVINFRGELKRLGIAEAERQGHTGQAYSQFMQAWEASPPPEAVKAAKDYAHYVTFTQPLEGVMAKIGAVGHSTMMMPFTPFFDTLVNVQKYELEWIPGLNMLVKKSREDLSSMGPRQDQALAKLGMGSAMMTAALGLYMDGYLTGPGPSDKKLLKVMKEINGFQENSFVYTDDKGTKHYIGINRFDPINFPFTFAAAYGDIALESLNGRAISQDTLAELALAGVHALGEVAMTRNYAQGFQQALELITAKDMNTYNKLEKMGQRIAGQVVPSGVAQINKEFDEYQRATYSALDAIYARLPGKSTQLMPEVNLAGQPRFKTAALGPDWVSPIPYSQGKPDVVGQEILKNGISIDAPPKSLFGPPPPALVGEENSAHGILLDAKQYYRYATLAGNELKMSTDKIEPALRAIGYTGDLPSEKMGMWDILTALVQSKTYRQLANDVDPQSAEPGPQSAQAKVIRSVIQGYRRAAAAQMLREDKELREKFLGKVLDRAESFGGTRARAQAEQAIRTMDLDSLLGMTGIE